jgi:hypothetical protein
MPEWWHTLWSYRLEDLLLFSPRAHARLFELVNRETWPAAAAAAGLPALLAGLLLSRHRRAEPLALALLGLATLAFAELHLRQSLAALLPAAQPLALGFGLLALVALGLATAGLRSAGPGASNVPASITPAPGEHAARALAALLCGLALAWPLAAPWLGRPWWQAEPFALAPDPTVLGWLAWGTLTARRGLAWLALMALPLAWCALAGLLGAAMASPLAAVLPMAAAAVMAMRLLRARRSARAGRS